MELSEASQITARAGRNAQRRRADLALREAEQEFRLSGDEWEYGWQQPSTGIVITDRARGELLGWPSVRRRVSDWEPTPTEGAATS